MPTYRAVNKNHPPGGPLIEWWDQPNVGDYRYLMNSPRVCAAHPGPLHVHSMLPHRPATSSDVAIPARRARCGLPRRCAPSPLQTSG
eukprot:1903358-Prymnesium_polylepis.1